MCTRLFSKTNKVDELAIYSNVSSDQSYSVKLGVQIFHKLGK